MDFEPEAQIPAPSSASGRRGRASPGTRNVRLHSKLQQRERSKWCAKRTFFPVSISSQIFPLLNPKLKKKGRWCSADSADPGLVTQRLRLGWVKLWSNKWEEIGARKFRLRLAIYSKILDLCVFELRSSK